jgi:glutathione S-transferase
MPSPHFHIIGHELCPYVQRAAITMLELGILYDRTDIDLDDKPDWLAELSPTGKVPVLVVNKSTVLFESNVISEYLMELGSRSLHPADVLERGKHRAWIAYGDQLLDVIASIIYLTQTRKEQDQAFGKMAGMLAILDTQMAEAPYFSGRQFSLIDAVFATVFRFFPVIDPLTPLDLFADCPRLISWSVALAEHPSVKRAVPEHFNAMLRKFIAGKHSFAAAQLS